MRRLAPIVFGVTTAMLSACGSATPPDPASASPSTTSPAAHSSSAEAPATTTAPATHSAKWVDLQVGDCLSAPPPTDPSVVDVSLIDCHAPHAAEVFLRSQVAVNAALAAVADQRCAAGLAQYTHTPGRYSSTYLIDSNMDRTGYTALPSTVICVLQSPDGRVLSGSARA